ncbi:hypothetical protein SLEP1_g15480 [Rubroshorea leprosula]|uniref:Uncharacterized protein n=1 Tax=Rubroshorea leprosula TaxID=152421 RepID=A0AAV5IWM9_9ROSI|nr:hypothetical protein SLEP1_g15480 [Rubroshorea leprosula]
MPKLIGKCSWTSRTKFQQLIFPNCKTGFGYQTEFDLELARKVDISWLCDKGKVIFDVERVYALSGMQCISLAFGITFSALWQPISALQGVGWGKLDTVDDYFFVRANYSAWSVKMNAHLRAFDLWDIVENDREPAALSENPTLNQIKRHIEEFTKSYKALTCIHRTVLDEIFNRIITCETAKEVWDTIKEEFQGDQKTKEMQINNLRREFEVFRMKETKTVKEYSDRVMKTMNQIRVLGGELKDKRVVEKVLVSLPKKFEHKISSLEDLKDLSKMTLSELVGFLQVVEQRKAIRQEITSEGAFPVTEKGKAQVKEDDTQVINGGKKQFNNRKGKEKKRKDRQAKVAEIVDEDEEKLFMASKIEKNCVATVNGDLWLMDSGCINHMTPNLSIFKSIDKSYSSKVKLGNGDLVQVKGKGGHGIKNQLTIPYNPQQNGVYERKNRSVMNMAWCLMFEKNLPRKFWAEAVNTSVYLLNRVQTKALDLQFEDFLKGHGIKHQLTVPYNPQQNGVCYSSQSKGYRVFNVRTGKIEVNRDVKFNEAATWNWENLEVISSETIFEDEIDEDYVVRGTRSLADIYERCNVSVVEPPNFYETMKSEVWRAAVLEEFNMIQKNDTCNEKLIQQFQVEMKKEFEMNDLGKMSYFLEMEISQNSQASTPIVPCEKLRSDDGAAKIDARIYRSLIGRLLYLSATRPNIMHSVSLMSRFMHSPSEIHFKATERILRYVKGTTDFGVLYKRSINVKLIGFTDSDWAGSEEDMKSTSEQCFSIGLGVISWSSKKQDLVAKSIAEAEYIAASLAIDQVAWLRKLINDLKQPQIHPTELFCDNLSTVAVVKNHVLHDDQIADIFTKGLYKCKFENPRDKLGMSSISVKEE